MKPCIMGFAYCKPILSVDRTWLYVKYHEVLLILIVHDERKNAIPLAYALMYD